MIRPGLVVSLISVHRLEANRISCGVAAFSAAIIFDLERNACY
jgi:hypothetical protein